MRRKISKVLLFLNEQHWKQRNVGNDGTLKTTGQHHLNAHFKGDKVALFKCTLKILLLAIFSSCFLSYSFLFPQSERFPVSDEDDEEEERQKVHTRRDRTEQKSALRPQHLGVAS